VRIHSLQRAPQRVAEKKNKNAKTGLTLFAEWVQSSPRRKNGRRCNDLKVAVKTVAQAGVKAAQAAGGSGNGAPIDL